MKGIVFQAKAALLIATLFQSFLISAQSIWTNPITGTSPGTSNPYTIGDVVDNNITVSGIGRSPVIGGSFGSDAYRTRFWVGSSLDTSLYITFTLIPNTGQQIDFIDFIFSGFKSFTGPTNYAVRSSIDNFTSDLSTYSSFGNALFDDTILLNTPSFQNISGATEFRIYAWGATSNQGVFAISDFTFNGTTTPLSITFQDYDVTKKGNIAFLSWKLGGTDEGETIGIQHSTDGKIFQTLQVVNQNISSFTHKNPSRGINYYRLESISPDGKSHFSRTRSLVFDDRSVQAVLYPNPVSDKLYVISDNAISSIVLHNAFGALVLKSCNETTLDTRRLSNGVYTVLVTLENGGSERHILTVAR